MTVEMALAIAALLISALAALYSRRSVREAKNANDMGRLNALLALRSHYLALLEHQARLAEALKNPPSGLQAAQANYAELDSKLREVSREVDTYHAKLTGTRT